MVLLMANRLDLLVNIEARPANMMAMLASTSDSWGNIVENLVSTKKDRKMINEKDCYKDQYNQRNFKTYLWRRRTVLRTCW